MFRIAKGSDIGVVDRLRHELTTYEWKDGVRHEDRRFYVEDERYYYFLDTARKELKGTNAEEIKPFVGNANANFKSIAPFKLYDYQEIIRGFVMKQYRVRFGSIRTLVALATGKGKTAVACETFTKLNKRFSILILPKYVEKWILDINKYIDLTEDDYYIVKGGDSLIKLMEMEKKDIPRIVIFSNRTIYNAMVGMSTGEYGNKYPMPLYELMEHIGSSQLLVDEVHQEFNSIYNSAIMLNPHFLLGLSATFNADDKSVKRHLDNFFFTRDRINPLQVEKYRRITSIHYTIGFMKWVKWKSYFTGGYCHITFEGSIMRNGKLLNAYIEMLLHTYEDEVVRNKDANKGKTLIFASTAKMIDKLVYAFKIKYPDKDIRKYMGKDPLSNILEADLTFTTLGSSGTAIDVPNLRTVINTVSMKSTNQNDQVFGRLRAIDGYTPNYVYLWSESVGSQGAHHHYRMNLFKDRVLKWTLKDYYKDLLPMYGGQNNTNTTGKPKGWY
jgi:superfamily II DNA or RNA helicase